MHFLIKCRIYRVTWSISLKSLLFFFDITWKVRRWGIRNTFLRNNRNHIFITNWLFDLNSFLYFSILFYLTYFIFMDICRFYFWTLLFWRFKTRSNRLQKYFHRNLSNLICSLHKVFGDYFLTSIELIYCLNFHLWWWLK